MQIYVDMDGVLADFDLHYETTFNVKLPRRAFREPPYTADEVDWKAIRKTANFFRDIPPMADFKELWSFVEVYNPIILTGVPASVTEAATNKREWVDKNLGRDVSMVACLSKEKATWCRPGDILIDDWEKYRDLWVGAGGRWITHTSAAESVRQLKEML